jgi:L,D-transpeptidase ErfK/SrfK
MATVVDTITRLNQRKVEGMTFDYQQLRSLLETPNGRMVALNPQPEPDSKKEDIFEGVYEESTLRGT